METKLTAQNFDEIINTDKPVLIDFFATWCGPCRMIAPEVAAIAEENPDILVCKVDVDEDPSLAMKYGVASIPTLVVLKNGVQQAKSVGYCSKDEILTLLDEVK